MKLLFMNFNEVKTELRENYFKVGFELVEETETSLCFSFNSIKYGISKEEIEEYAVFQNDKGLYKKIPFETSICSNKYREQLVSSIDSRRMSLGVLMPDQNTVFGEKTEGKIFAEIGTISDLFININRFNRDFFPRTPMYSIAQRADRSVIYPIKSIFSRYISIKVYNIVGTTIEDAEKISSKTIEDSLFQLSYLKNVPVWIVEEFPYKRTTRLERFKFVDSYPSWTFPLKTSYNSDLIRFYQFAMSTTIPEFQFLSYYHILEYFFITVSNEKLYETIEKRIKDPLFLYSEKYYNFLIQDITNNKKETDERMMLKNVLEKYIDKKELRIFIELYETHLSDKRYTKKHDVFGTSLQVNLVDEHIMGNLAIHIKEIRNALVHSSEKYFEGTRYIPLTKSSKDLSKEIPLMKFLAEKIIIATSKPLE